MNIRMEKVFCHRDLTLSLAPGPALITGRNSAGKTSVATAVAAVLTHENNPMGLSATAYQAYLLDGETEGHVTIGDVSWRPTKGIEVRSIAGEQQKYLPHSLGLVDFGARRTREQRAALWEDLFLPADPAELLGELPIVPSLRDKLVAHIKQEGWDKTQTIYQELRRQQKRKWQDATSKTWGVKTGRTWTPDHWQPHLETTTEEDLRTKETKTRHTLERYVISAAVQQDTIDAAKSERDTALAEIESTIGRCAAKRSDLTGSRDELSIERTKANQELASMESELRHANDLIEIKAPHLCPHCQEGLMIDMAGKTMVTAWTPPTRNQVEKAHTTIATLDTSKKDLQSRVYDISVSVQSLEEQMGEVRREHDEAVGVRGRVLQQTKLADQRAVLGEGSEAAKAELADEARRALEDLQAFTLWNAARSAHDSIMAYDVICTALAPQGLRGKKVRVEMQRVHKALERIAVATGWAKIELSDDYAVSVGGRALPLCAQNERWKAQAVLQVATALITDTPIVIVDGADCLQDDSWLGLVKMAERFCRLAPAHQIMVCGTNLPDVEGWQKFVL